MNLVLREPWTVARFLDWEDRQEGKHEFDGTQIIDMTGGSRAHQRIVANLLRWFEDNLDAERFDAIQEMRIDVGGKVRYPDMTIVHAPVDETLATDGAPDPIPAGEAAVPATNGFVWSDRHTCMVCGGGAAFGFTMRQGVSVWTCVTHRSDGERVLVAPAPLPRTGS